MACVPLSESPLRWRHRFQACVTSSDHFSSLPIIISYFSISNANALVPLRRASLSTCGCLRWILMKSPTSWSPSLSLCPMGWCSPYLVGSPSCVVLRGTLSWHRSYPWSCSRCRSRWWCGILRRGLSPGWFFQGVGLGWNEKIGPGPHLVAQWKNIVERLMGKCARGYGVP